MGKYKHEGVGRNISIGGGKERADLFKDMSGGYNAMGDSNDPSPLYNYGGNSVAKRYSKGPLELTAEGKKKILASDANPEFKSAIAKQPIEMKGSHSPMYKSSCTSGGSSRSPYKVIGDPSKKEAKKYLKSIKKDPKREQKLDSIQNVYNKQFDDFDMGSKVKGGEKSFDKNYNILKKAGRDTIFGMYGKKK